ncbi:uncharacterized protein N7500_010343 [Penicillium coprophilum]|uniref:uncharacterized protein n=1 Tax=Penicillium coprophilum TaxID=36646 RepID=UPI0023915925|nr:uncharacterized protein N7500_010343 [Penicillium coprophilum]KAJ5154904.1 hypothetical protein N7500_010343 [Penicillium coprophilum]
MAPRKQEENVAIIRHRDLSFHRRMNPISFMQILCIEYVVTHFLRKCSSHCVAATIQREKCLKPWAQTTALGEKFPADCLGNTPMAPYK